jgi:hypothetical protein
VNRAAACAVLASALAACGGGGKVDHAAARHAFVRVPIDAAPGLSGLASDDAGGMWTVAERAGAAYRITLAPDLTPTVTRVAIAGVPPGVDLEAIAVLGEGRFAFGTEGKGDGSATVLLAGREDGAIVVDGVIDLPEDRLGVKLAANHGAEGVCGHADTIVTAIEATGQDGGGRFAPLVKTVRGEIVAVHRLRLATATGKLSGLDCTVADDGSIAGWAIERHFEVTRLVRFTLPPIQHDRAVIVPTLAIDLGPILHGSLNLEGIARTTDGRVVAVVDNQWKRITGPSELLVMRPEALR